MAHPVSKVTQAAAGRALSGRRYASFNAKGSEHVPSPRITVAGGGRRVVSVGGGRRVVSVGGGR